MRATIPQPELAAAAKWAARQIPDKALNPALHGMRLEAADDRLRLSVWDGTTAAHALLDADIDEPGLLVAPGKMLADTVAALRKSDIELAGHDELTLTSGHAEFVLPCIPIHDYPTLPALPDTQGSIDGDELAAAFKRIKDAIAAKAEGSTAGMTGIRFVADGDRLELCTTDRYRIATTWIPWDGTDKVHGVLPGRALADSVNALTGTLQVALPADGSGTAALIGERWQITTVLLDWPTFPHRVHEVSPNQGTITGTVDVDAEELKAAVQAATIVHDKAVYLAFDGDHATVHAASDARGRLRLDASYEGDSDRFELKVEPRYLADALGQFTGHIRIDVTTPIKPFQLVDPGDDTYRHVVMPLRPN
jgi:DNA polymerase-3 subunit beta